MKIGKETCSMDDLIGAPFGATFELAGSKLQRLTPGEVAGDGPLLGAEEETRDNRNLRDTDAAQKVWFNTWFREHSTWFSEHSTWFRLEDTRDYRNLIYRRSAKGVRTTFGFNVRQG
jgi:hypothetical protein